MSLYDIANGDFGQVVDTNSVFCCYPIMQCIYLYIYDWLNECGLWDKLTC